MKFKWVLEGGQVCVYENGSIWKYDEAALRLALKTEIEANRPPNGCSYSFEQARQRQIQKFQAGLELLLNGGPQ
jgi:hypothetical protein